MSRTPTGPDAIDDAKRALRRAMKERIATIRPFARARRAERAAALALRSPALAGARLVLAYRALPDEIDCDPLVAALAHAGARIAFPAVVAPKPADGAGRMILLAIDGDDPLDPACWTTDRFGVRAPKAEDPRVRRLAARDLDAVIVPGRAFDRTGARLGRGGGYYDRLLRALRPDARRASLGLAFEEQVVDSGRRPAPDADSAEAQAHAGVPCAPHDARVAAIATDRTIRRARPPARN